VNAHDRERSSGATLLVRALEAQGVDVVFGYPGGAILPVYDALIDAKFRHVLVRHEQAAALAANGYARASGKVGVCMATSGPGATNLVTGIADAFLDSVPMVIITGQVPTALMGTDAFQEVDVFGMTMPIVKHSFQVRRAADVADTLDEAFFLARSGRPGPVLIDLPKDVGLAATSFAPRTPTGALMPRAPSPLAIERASQLLRAARRPLLYIGGGVRWAGAIDELRAFALHSQMPAVATLMALGALPTDHPLFLGMLGMHGTRAANLAVQSCDLLVCAGARFDDRATGKLAEFAPSARVIHLDIDPAEIGKLRAADVPLLGDMRASLRALAVSYSSPARAASHGSTEAWRSECLANKAEHAWRYDAPIAGVYGPRFLDRLSRAAGPDAIVTCDVGQHQMWVAQHCHFARPERHLSSGGLGTMGFGLPAAIGASFAKPDALVINVTGDGSIMMNLQELATVMRYGLSVKIVLFDNQALGMVRQWQELFADKRYSHIDLSDNPDFVRVAESFGIPAFGVSRADQVDDAIARIVSEPGPLLAHVSIDAEANVWPLVPPGCSNATMLEGAAR
jgi:acetolactate synthase-1/2/3 large subunit